MTLLLAPAARAAESAEVQEILDGKEFYIDQKQARVKEKAQAPQQISTQNSRGQIRFEAGAVGRLNRFSILRLGQGCFLVDRGQILVSGKQSGCTRSARLSVRGTNYLLEVKDNGDSELSVLEGSVQVEPLRDGQPTGAAPATVQAGQRLRLSPEGVVLTLVALSSGDYSSILSGPLFEGFRLPLPAAEVLDSYLRAHVPGVSLPSLPLTLPSLPISLPRFF
ncbi:MAG: iron dicitrate transport regulator FecR [Synechococcaceae cyanobacterium ELA263]